MLIEGVRKLVAYRLTENHDGQKDRTPCGRRKAGWRRLEGKEKGEEKWGREGRRKGCMRV